MNNDVQIAVITVADNQVIALGEDVSIITPPPESVSVVPATAVSIGGTSSVGALDDLSDVDTSTVTPTNGQVLTWDETAGQWTPAGIPPASVSTFDYQTTGKWVPRTSVLSTVTGITGATAITNCVAISQADYDAIVTPDPATLYVIV